MRRSFGGLTNCTVKLHPGQFEECWTDQLCKPLTDCEAQHRFSADPGAAWLSSSLLPTQSGHVVSFHQAELASFDFKQ
ncbi:hypothetical protein T4E_3775 [Trichinella pseudospiralis]|uniref:Uncharacterized protein n=1 Tax=Trichinella pseudospiralis TaxID=6337 RepID=A0A0V0XPK7_TRIPS|nr:hypothetical protein T4E_3775 [Trichinella pseudospiralis]